ncbi:TP53-regulated inhibitor of apoptosis 1 [Entomophthora muscae]|uniref:TP53-regulated inhibitor of apoptosis 1 n=1 Tax=Entomophthora muscae TaxID=34485 RepID=A0ACC2U9K3_9FUNG|nr:TP53-regulated inhibitor of apoptosis 1 [Entomophthora muscae]
MESLALHCTQLKKEYDSCFHTWYTEKFLKGNLDQDCKEKFEKYQACIKQTLKERGIEALISEVRSGSR